MASKTVTRSIVNRLNRAVFSKCELTGNNVLESVFDNETRLQHKPVGPAFCEFYFILFFYFYYYFNGNYMNIKVNAKLQNKLKMKLKKNNNIAVHNYAMNY